MRVLLVHNPEAGDDDHAREHLVELLEGAGHEVDYRSSKDGWKAGLTHHPELVVVAGGDGTVSKIARATAGTGLPVTILPAGTANNIAGALGLAGVSHEDLVHGWPAAALHPFDLGLASGPWGEFAFVESVGVGALADLMSEIERGGSGYVNELQRRDERLTAALEVLQKVVATAAPTHCELQVDGEDLSDDYLLLEVLNFGAAGPNLHLAPAADGSDGRLDVVLVRAHEREPLLQHLASPSHRPLPPEVLQVRHVRQVSMRCDATRLHLDDRLWKGEAGIITAGISVRPGVLTFLVPPVISLKGRASAQA